MTERDRVERADEAWQQAAQRYISLKRAADAANEQANDAKADLVKLAQHPSETGSGVTVTRFRNQGSVDYKQMPQLRGVELARYRGTGKMETLVTIA